ncbi:protein kinase [Streptomyces sp. NPDC059637]|uniref:serine/threonine-protein kinase n=1 Tax=Streptomyces sp. NPDC059637 TaxID=3347752 RepID=UPI0036981CF1
MTREGLGRYEPVGLLGRGGMGEVWEARDRELGRRVAVKILAPRGRGAGSEAARRRFLREARVTAGLRHRGVPVVHDTGRLGDGRPYLVMELVEGSTLSAVLEEEGSFPVARAADVAVQVADVLAHAHRNGVVHRDLTPSNVMIMPDGTVKVLDFGIAAAKEPDPEDTRITATHAVPGTPGFMAPEQAQGRPGPPGDLYGLGCVLYRLLAGVPPFTAPNDLMLMYRHLHDTPAPLSEHRPDVPGPFADLVMRLLAKDPLDRPASAEEVRDLARSWAAPAPASASAPAPASAPSAPAPAAPVPAPTAPVPAPRAESGASASGNRDGGAAAAVARARELADREGPGRAEAFLREYLDASGRPAEDPLCVPAGIELYDLMRRAGEPGRALEGFTGLGGALRRARSAADRDVLACRAGAARCLAALGRTAEALREFEGLLPVQERALGAADPAVLDTRYEAAVLLARAGERRRAYERLVRLEGEQRAVLPEEDGRHARTRQLVDRLDRLLRGGR